MGKAIRLYWWSEIFIQKKDRENYGDLLGKYLVEKISGRPVTWLRANRFYIKNLWQPVYVTIGSVLDHIGSHCTVWGSGIISKDALVSPAKILAVRGPLSRKRLLALNIDCPEIYGDPALLLPHYYAPKVVKKFSLGIIPHIIDYKNVVELYGDVADVTIIDFLTNDIERTTSEILACEHIISSSLHGIILAHAYGIPAVQVSFSDKIFGDGVKYHDYFLSVGLKTYEPMVVSQEEDANHLLQHIKNHNEALPLKENISEIQENLMSVCPFKNNAR